MNKSIWCKPTTKFKIGEILLIKFDAAPSILKVVEADRSKNMLKVLVIKDYYTPDKGSRDTPWKEGEIVDIGKHIFEQYWGFERANKRVCETLPKLYRTLYE